MVLVAYDINQEQIIHTKHLFISCINENRSQDQLNIDDSVKIKIYAIISKNLPCFGLDRGVNFLSAVRSCFCGHRNVMI